jgi:hypothetical protein
MIGGMDELSAANGFSISREKPCSLTPHNDRGKMNEKMT